MSSQELNEWDKKAIEIIKIIDGLSQTQINHILSLVNYSVSQSPTEIKFSKIQNENINADLLNGGRNPT